MAKSICENYFNNIALEATANSIEDQKNLQCI